MHVDCHRLHPSQDDAPPGTSSAAPTEISNTATFHLLELELAHRLEDQRALIQCRSMKVAMGIVLDLTAIVEHVEPYMMVARFETCCNTLLFK